MSADILRHTPLPIRLISMVGVIAGGIIGVFQVVDMLKAPIDRAQAQSQALFQEFKDHHVTDWSRIDEVSSRAFNSFKDTETSDDVMARWHMKLITSFERGGREQVIRLALFFEGALACVMSERCDEADALAYFEGPICIFWNKTWPYYEHLRERGVLFGAEVARFVDQRDCRGVELRMLATGRPAAVSNDVG